MSFNWHVYLSETGAEVSPSDLFEHVSRSLKPLLQKEQTLEAISDPTEVDPIRLRWWPAEVVTISGYLILLKWCTPLQVAPPPTPPVAHRPNASPTPSSDCFWFDTRGKNWQLIRPMSKVNKYDRSYWPPSMLKVESGFKPDCNGPFEKWIDRLNRHAVSQSFFKQRALYIHQTLRVGSYFECEHEHNPCFVWPAKVISNIGGRVRLSWFGTDSRKPNLNQTEYGKNAAFTLFYLHRRLHPLGWGKHYSLAYCPPPGLLPDRTISNVDAFVRGAPSAVAGFGDWDMDVRKIAVGHPLYHRDPPLHEFKVGWKLEAVNPNKPYVVQPATVVQVFNSRYFLVELDELPEINDEDSPSTNHPTPSPTPTPPSKSERTRFVTYAGAAEIMPVNTSQLRGMHLSPPPGWPSKQAFSWTNYLTYLANLDPQSNRAIHVENGLLRAASTNNLLVSNHHVHTQFNAPWNPASPHGSHSGAHKQPSNDDALVDKFSSSTATNSDLFCPPESMFRGVQITDIFSPTPGSPHSSDHSTKQSVCGSPTGASNTTSASITTTFQSNPPHSNCRFLLGMKLEIILPDHLFDPHHTTPASDAGSTLCTATVTRVDESNLLWILPDRPDLGRCGNHENEEYSVASLRPIMIDALSTNLYPVGWAVLIGHPLHAPMGYADCLVQPDTAGSGDRARSLEDRPPTCPLLWNVGLRSTHDLQYETITYDGEEVCPAVYLNTKCYLGPFLCRTNLDLLPQRFGPGPTTRVMHNLLQRLVSASYRPLRMLRMLEADWTSAIVTAVNNLRAAQRPNPDAMGISRATTGRFGLRAVTKALTLAEVETIEQRRDGMRVVLVRTRCPRRGVKIEAPVEICCRARAVNEFCRQISLLFEACPHLLSLNPPASHSKLHTPKELDQPLPPNSMKPRWAFCSLLPSSHVQPECPSFCMSRLRSRNFDKLPGWKRRINASLRPFGLQPPIPVENTGKTAVHRGSGSSLRTRAAVAAQRQQQQSGRPMTPIRNHPGLVNGTSIGRAARRNRGRAIGTKLHGHHRTLSHATSIDDDITIMGSLEPSIHPTDQPMELHQPPPVPTSPRLLHFSYPGHQAQQKLPGVGLHSPWHRMPESHANGGCIPPRTRPQGRLVDPMSSDYPPLPDNGLANILAEAPRVTLTSNPLFWSSKDLAAYLGQTDCREMWPWLAAEAVDGQAFMLLTLPVLYHLVGLRWEDALRLARHVISVKRAFVEQFGADTKDPHPVSSRAT